MRCEPARRRIRRPTRRCPSGGGDAGYATAELAVVLPALVFLLGVLLWGAMAGSAQLRCVDAAREGARAAARGDPDAAVQAAARAAAPPGARVVVSWDGDLVRVAVTARSSGPGGFGRVLAVGVGATAVARVEPEPDGVGP